MRRPRQDDGVSDVVAQVLMLTVTVSVFAGLAVVVMGELDQDAAAARADLRVLRGEDAMVLRHQGGEDVPLADLTLLLELDGVPTTVPGTDLADAFADGAHWRAGESLCVTCRYPGQEVGRVRLVQAGTVILHDTEAGVVGGAGTLASLRAVAVAVVPSDPAERETVTFRADVANDGAAATNVVVRFIVNGTPLGDTVIAGIAGGGSASATSPTWPAWAGDHTIQAVVDPEDAITELDEGDNTASTSLHVEPSVADPGAPFEDVDGDLRYTNGVDVLLAIADVTDGVHDAGANGLVIPASVGAVSAGDIDFRGLDVAIDVDLTSTGNALELVATDRIVFTAHTASAQGGASATLLQAGGALDVTGGTFDAGSHQLTAGGALRANASSVQATKQDALFTSGADLDIEGASLDASRDLEATLVSGATLRLDQAVLIDKDGTLVVAPTDVVVTGTPAQGGWTT